MLELNKVYQGDCLELMKDIPDKSVDLVVTDPPYKINGNGFKARGGFLGNRKVIDDIESIKDGFDVEILDILIKKMKKINIYIYCNKDLLIDLILYFKNREEKLFIDILTEHITNPTPFCNNTYLNDTDYILFVRESGCKVNGNYHSKRKYEVKTTNKKDKTLYKHPTPKYVDLVKKYIINSSNENDLILDPFIGSGTTGVACVDTNRNFIGIELDSNYCEIARKRIDESLRIEN